MFGENGVKGADCEAVVVDKFMSGVDDDVK